MKVLSIDTASDVCGVSVLDNTSSICKLDTITGRTHSENLMPMIKDALEQVNVKLNDLDLCVCDIGPGSFTGIRIGIATAKAFHDSLELPCVGVSSLEALAYNMKLETKSEKKDNQVICSILDCKNDNCYFALYENTPSESTLETLIEPEAESIEGTLSILKSYCDDNFNDYKILFVGDGSKIYETQIKGFFNNKNIEFADSDLNILDSYSLGVCGLKKYENGIIDENLLPLYLKKPQAQRQLEEKMKKIKVSSMSLSDFDKIENILYSDFDDFWNKDVLKSELISDTSNYLMAEIDGNIAGFAGIKSMVDDADLMNIVVKKDCRNQGIGSVLLENVIDLSKSLSLSSITLEVMEDNHPAIHLYEKFDFKKISTRKNYYDNKDGIIMKRII